MKYSPSEAWLGRSRLAREQSAAGIYRGFAGWFPLNSSTRPGGITSRGCVPPAFASAKSPALSWESDLAWEPLPPRLLLEGWPACPAPGQAAKPLRGRARRGTPPLQPAPYALCCATAMSLFCEACSLTLSKHLPTSLTVLPCHPGYARTRIQKIAAI